MVDAPNQGATGEPAPAGQAAVGDGAGGAGSPR